MFPKKYGSYKNLNAPGANYPISGGFPDLALHIVGVAEEVVVVEGIADIVGAACQEGQRRRVVETLK